MRINHANLSRTIIYGTAAVRISEPGIDATHRWRVFVRGYKDLDISYFIRSITFKTHETFTNPTRTVEGPPFEIEECGWGEFLISGKIYFTDPHEKPLGFVVSLKLHNDATNRTIGDIQYNENEIVNERMDTIIFESPSEAIYKIMKNHEEPPFDEDIQEKIDEERTMLERSIDYLISKLGEESMA